VMESSSVSTNIIDHIVHLTPPGSVKKTTEQFTSLGFNVIPGGVHADGLTENALVILPDGAYIELISFTHPVSHYPPNSPERTAREAHPWSEASGPGAHPGWIDFAFLGLGSSNRAGDGDGEKDPDLSDILNARSKREGSGVSYVKTIPGGRVRPDGRELRWKITAPNATVHGRGFLPFFCGDVTDRRWRVPLEPSENARHPNTTKALAHLRFLVPSKAELQHFANQVTTIVGHLPLSPSVSSTGSHEEDEVAWELIAPASKGNAASYHFPAPNLILGVAKSEDERGVSTVAEHKPMLYEIALWADREQELKMTPFGRIRWLLVQE